MCHKYLTNNMTYSIITNDYKNMKQELLPSFWNYKNQLDVVERPMIYKRTVEEQAAYGRAEEFLKLWDFTNMKNPNRTEEIYGNCPALEIMENRGKMERLESISRLLKESYLTPFAKFSILGEFTQRLIYMDKTIEDPFLKNLGFDLKNENYGIFDISQDMAEIEAQLMSPIVGLYIGKAGEFKGTEGQKDYLRAWQESFEKNYRLKAPGQFKEKKPIKKVIKDWFVQAYDANATLGHIVDIVVGSVGMNTFLRLIHQEDFITRIGPAGGLLALALIGSFNLPNRGMDSILEKVPHRVLSFAPTVAMGMLAGMMVKDWEQAVAITPLIIVLAASGISYWNISQMSRNFHVQMLQQTGMLGARHPDFSDFAGRVKATGNHGMVDDVFKLLTEQENYWKIVRKMRAELTPTIHADEPFIKAGLRDIRKYLRITN